jgi:hypothetical protein
VTQGYAPPTAFDAGAEWRRARVLALLAQNPTWRIAVVTEIRDSVIVGVALRDIGYGEVAIEPSKYNPFALIELLDRHGDEPPTVH